MAQQFSGTQNVQKRTSTLVFLKGSTAPLVLYVDQPEALYTELSNLMKSQSTAIVEKETKGPLKKVSFVANQIAALAIQEEVYQ